MDEHRPTYPAATPSTGSDLQAARERSESRKRSAASTTADFTEAAVPVQFKLPRDLVASLKLHSIQTGKTMSELVLAYMTTGETVTKAWVSTRKAG